MYYRLQNQQKFLTRAFNNSVTCHPEHREGSPRSGTEPFSEISHDVRDDSTRDIPTKMKRLLRA